MKSIICLRPLRAIALAISLIAFPVLAVAQRGNTGIKTDTRILYHGGPVMPGSTDVYLIWYGNWPANAPGSTETILTEYVSFLGSSPYFQINTGYIDSFGNSPNGALLYAGSVHDQYSHGPSLSVSDIQEIVAQQITAQNLPLDVTGIYLVLASPDVTDIRPDGSQFCTPGTFPHHGVTPVSAGIPIKYGFIGNPMRCPSSAPLPFQIAGSTPNDNFAADVMVSPIAHVLNALVTNPNGTAWFDRYGFENAAKCHGTFGTTYSAPNGAPANMRLGTRHYLIQQNWVNARKGYCGLSNP